MPLTVFLFYINRIRDRKYGETGHHPLERRVSQLPN
jgi:hypothetical protein